jgi:anti-sigma factor RsiW
VNYDDETLMAYADGELDEQRRAEIADAVAKDPELARRVDQHRALRSRVAGAFRDVPDQPVPDRLLMAAKPPARGATPPTQAEQAPQAEGTSRAGTTARTEPVRGKVVRFPSRGTRPPPTPWRSREWFAMAASLVLGVLLSWKFLVPVGDYSTQGGSLVANGPLARALDSQLASEQSGDDAVLIGLTFEAKDGAYCRSFVSRGTSTAGLACRVGDDWRVPFSNSVQVPEGDLRQAAAVMPPALLQVIEERMAREPLDAAAELAARDARWGSRP